MFILTILLDAVTNKNLLLGFMPESLALLLFGGGLFGFAFSLRRFYNRGEETHKEELTDGRQVNIRREN
jgi:hypothetical protein